MPIVSLRGLDPDALAGLKVLASREQTSVNALILNRVEQGLGHARPRRYGDLEHLAGAWSAVDAAAFEQAVAPLSEIGPGLWRCDVGERVEPECATS